MEEAPDLGRSNKQVLRPTYGLTMTMHPAILANSWYIYQASGQIRVPSVQLARRRGERGKGEEFREKNVGPLTICARYLSLTCSSSARFFKRTNMRRDSRASRLRDFGRWITLQSWEGFFALESCEEKFELFFRMR